jgi:hypothetical protein
MHFRLRGLFGTFLLESIADLNFVSSEINKQVSENRGRFSKGGFGICQSASLGSETVFLLYLSRERFSTSLLGSEVVPEHSVRTGDSPDIGVRSSSVRG